MTGLAGGGAGEVSWVFTGVLCVLCWASGALVGYAVRMQVAASSRRSLKPRRRRRSSYYFSEDEGSWGDQRWRRRLAWASAIAVITCLTTAGAVALANYKTRPNAAAGYRN